MKIRHFNYSSPFILKQCEQTLKWELCNSWSLISRYCCPLMSFSLTTVVNCACHYCESPSSHITNTLHASAITVHFCQSQSTREWKSQVQREKERCWGTKVSCVSCKVRELKCCSCTSKASQDSRLSVNSAALLTSDRSPPSELTFILLL